jgi:hypothetical protein
MDIWVKIGKCQNFDQTEFVDKMKKWNGKKGTPHLLIQESDKSMGLRITTRKDS